MLQAGRRAAGRRRRCGHDRSPRHRRPRSTGRRSSPVDRPDGRRVRRAAASGSPARASCARVPCRRWRSSALAATAGLSVWQWNENVSIIAGALRDGRPHAGADACSSARRASARCCCPGAAPPRRRPATASTTRCCSPRSSAWSILVAARELRRAVPRLRAALDPALRAVRDADAARALARVGPEVPDHRLGRLGHAALRPRADLRRDGLDGLLRRRRRRRRARATTRCCSPASRWWSPASRSRPPSRRSTSGRPTSTRARRPRSPRSWRSPPRPRRSACCCGSSTSALIGAASTLGAGAGRARRRHDRRRQRRRDRAVLAQAHARLLLGRPGGLHARRRGRLDAARASRRRSSTSPPTC